MHINFTVSDLVRVSDGMISADLHNDWTIESLALNARGGLDVVFSPLHGNNSRIVMAFVGATKISMSVDSDINDDYMGLKQIVFAPSLDDYLTYGFSDFEHRQADDLMIICMDSGGCVAVFAKSVSIRTA